ncbi:hypothetical protein E6R18_31645 [Streptomyces sp. A1277]|nr:hypothetical protein E6R18_31645 [Streptomyces sp. A1277]
MVLGGHPDRPPATCVSLDPAPASARLSPSSRPRPGSKHGRPGRREPAGRPLRCPASLLPSGWTGASDWWSGLRSRALRAEWSAAVASGAADRSGRRSPTADARRPASAGRPLASQGTGTAVRARGGLLMASPPPAALHAEAAPGWCGTCVSLNGLGATGCCLWPPGACVVIARAPTEAP